MTAPLPFYTYHPLASYFDENWMKVQIGEREEYMIKNRNPSCLTFRPYKHIY